MESPADTVLTVSVIALVLELLIGVSIVVWAVGKIRATTEVLNATVDGLSRTVETLAGVVERVNDKVDNHGERIAVLETKVK